MILLAVFMACGDDGSAESTTEAPTTISSADSTVSSAESTSESATSSPPTGSGSTSGPADSTTGLAMPCAMQLEEASCVAADPGNGQVCEWVSYYPVTTRGEVGSLECSFGGPQGLCVQQLGTDGGTPFGSCGGDGTPPVYYRDVDGVIELVQTDGFFTPEGWSNCDCHDGQPDPDDSGLCTQQCDRFQAAWKRY